MGPRRQQQAQVGAVWAAIQMQGPGGHRGHMWIQGVYPFCHKVLSVMSLSHGVRNHLREEDLKNQIFMSRYYSAYCFK